MQKSLWIFYAIYPLSLWAHNGDLSMYQQVTSIYWLESFDEIYSYVVDRYPDSPYNSL